MPRRIVGFEASGAVRVTLSSSRVRGLSQRLSVRYVCDASRKTASVSKDSRVCLRLNSGGRGRVQLSACMTRSQIDRSFDTSNRALQHLRHNSVEWYG